MILPLGDQPNPRGVPLLTYAIIAANVVVYIWITLPLSFQPVDPRDPLLRDYLTAIGQNLPRGASLSDVLRYLSAYDLFVFSHGYRPAEPSVVALFTSMFLHGGFLHLFGNMLFLWIYGDNVEHRLGSVAFLFWYLVTGAAATLFHSLFDSGSSIPLVGASGAISGILGFYFLWFPHNQVRLWVFLFPFFMNVVLAPARLVLGFFLLVDNLLPFLVTRGAEGAGVAYGAHIGGFLAGVGVAWVMNRRGITELPPEYRAARAAKPASGTLSESINEAIRAGDLEQAAKLYFAVPTEMSRRLLSPSDSLAFAEGLSRAGHPRAALVVYQRHLRDYPRGPGAAEAHLFAGLLQLRAFGEVTAAYQHLVDALDFDPSPELESLIREALAEITARQKFQVGRRPH